MSVIVGYFFNWPGTLGDLAAQFRLWIGCDLQPYEGNPDDLYCRFLGMEFSLYEHELVNDRGLNFEDYRFEAAVRTPIPDNDFRTLQVTVMSSLVYALYRRLGVGDGMLAYDVSLLLARYEARAGTDGRGQLYDSVSGEVVKYPQHIMALMERVPGGDYL